jgi:archaeosortase A (PGF-CTERM-specific)
MLVAKEKHDVLLVLTKAAAIICLIYFPFAEIEILNEAIILVTARITGTTLNAVGVPVQVVHVQMPQSPYAIRLGGLQLGIILACTAIESMALFAGVILAVDALPKSKFKAFMVSVPVIYVLNIIRNVLVTTAYGYCWFGTPERSFDIAHSYLARIGSVLALMGIAYAVIMILPEVLDMLEGIMDLFRPIHRR